MESDCSMHKDVNWTHVQIPALFGGCLQERMQDLIVEL